MMFDLFTVSIYTLFAKQILGDLNGGKGKSTNDDSPWDLHLELLVSYTPVFHRNLI